ncbi:putative transcription factor interactor and regulator CCHC(Zn) family [Helianthus annuus]|nr:putative transcription factor interactor and regulator CCHC(Zn) family [Helianthus annuus]
MDVMMFIAGLSPKYASARPFLLSNSTAISSMASTYHLLREMYGPDVSPTNMSALVSKGTGQSSYMKKGTRRGTRGHGSNLLCHLCHEPGHVRYNCQKTAIVASCQGIQSIIAQTVLLDLSQKPD